MVHHVLGSSEFRKGAARPIHRSGSLSPLFWCSWTHPPSGPKPVSDSALPTAAFFFFLGLPKVRVWTFQLQFQLCKSIYLLSLLIVANGGGRRGLFISPTVIEFLRGSSWMMSWDFFKPHDNLGDVSSVDVCGSESTSFLLFNVKRMKVPAAFYWKVLDLKVTQCV